LSPIKMTNASYRLIRHIGQTAGQRFIALGQNDFERLPEGLWKERSDRYLVGNTFQTDHN